MPSAFIDDGYTIHCYINSRKDYDRIAFEYRPVTREEQVRSSRKITSKDEEAVVRAAEFTAGRLVGWDLQTNKGEPVAVTADNLRRLHADAFERIYGIALGAEQPDGILDGGEAWDEETSEKN